MHTCKQTHTHTHSNTHAHTHMHTHVHTHTHAHTHTNIHTYVHKNMQEQVFLNDVWVMCVADCMEPTFVYTDTDLEGLPLLVSRCPEDRSL